MSDPLVLLGEVRTTLLPHSVALSEPEVEQLLSLLPGQPVTIRKRPLGRVVSPLAAVGVDCDLATLRGGQNRAIGTVSAHAVVVGGRMGQSSACTRVVRAAKSNREYWSHYLAELGTVELIPRIGADAVAARELCEGFLEASRDDTLDLGSISERMLSQVRMDILLDHRPPLRTSATRLRWVARVDPAAEAAGDGGVRSEFCLVDADTRTVRLTVPTVAHLAEAQRFCEDLAAHDWLLTTLGTALADIDAGPRDRDNTPQLMSLLKELAHLWMPGAHTPLSMREPWHGLEQDPGFTRQWSGYVGRLRDGVALATLETLRAAKL